MVYLPGAVLVSPVEGNPTHPPPTPPPSPVALANKMLTPVELPEDIEGLTGQSQIAVASSLMAVKYLFLSDFCCSCFWV